MVEDVVEGPVDCVSRDNVVGDTVEDPVESPIDCVSRLCLYG